MRTSRCVFYTIMATVLSLFYVAQQTEIVKLGYRINRAEHVLEAMRDKKTSLEFTLSSLESPLHLDKSLFLHNNEFEMAQSYKLVKLTPAPAPKTAYAAASKNRFSVFQRLAKLGFFADRQAEAKTIK
ncbi:MAG: hypothetical protein WC732_02175 [Candidatus Omnitrophota bacterium]